MSVSIAQPFAIALGSAFGAASGTVLRHTQIQQDRHCRGKGQGQKNPTTAKIQPGQRAEQYGHQRQPNTAGRCGMPQWVRFGPAFDFAVQVCRGHLIHAVTQRADIP